MQTIGLTLQILPESIAVRMKEVALSKVSLCLRGSSVIVPFDRKKLMALSFHDQDPLPEKYRLFEAVGDMDECQRSLLADREDQVLQILAV